MRQRVGETDADYQARRAEYDRSRSGRGNGKFRVRSRTLNAEGEVKSVTEVRRGRNPSKLVKIQNATLARTSTLYDAEGRVAARWEIERPEDRDRFAAWREIADEFTRNIVRVEPQPTLIGGDTNSNLLVEYAVGDHHMGMLSWRPETGASYDLDISEELLAKAFTYLTEVAPPAPRGVVEFLGDYLHYDSLIPQTPTGKHSLDADGRYQKMIRYGVRAMRNAINACLRHHAELLVIVEDGNHDPFSTPFLVECLTIAYENEPRVTIDPSPGHYHYFRHGKCLIGTHHGHGAKPEALPGIMSVDRAADWGATEYRAWRTGHVHSKRQWDFPGCSVESFRILPPSDAWAHQKGYRSHRGMEAIVLDDRGWEKARYPVTPRMLEHM